MHDGNVMNGKVIEQTVDYVKLSTINYGVLTLKTSLIKKIRKAQPTKDGQRVYWHENIQSARYFWAPNGYGLNKGEGYYQNYWVLFNQFSYGFSNKFTLGIGIMPLFLFGGGAPTPIWITPKFSFPVVENKFNIGAGGIIGTILGDDGFGFGLAYATTTFGSRDKNISIGLGWGYADGDWADSPLINISGIARVGNKGSFILTENYFIALGSGQYLTIISLGGRSLVKSVSIDYGLFVPINKEIDSFFAIPWLGITIPFESKNKK
ncbi:MAG: hypothetical protein C0598_08340 [Marinilabiliales bacterium]|nr:MAG: hypothetical protein C0598_08340 [Marinilabiliales bacterium]